MKNLFSINKTDSKEAMAFDENPYFVVRVSEAVRHKLEHAFDGMSETAAKREPTAEERALKKKSNILWLASLICIVAALAVFMLGNGQTVMQVISIALLVVSVVLNFRGRRITQKLAMAEAPSEDDFSLVTDRLAEAAAEASRELGVPDSAVSMEILPAHYRMTGRGPVSVSRKNHFDNISVSAYLEGGALCLASAQELYRVPLSDIRGYRVYDEDFEIDFWLKEDEPDSDRYRDFNIRSAGLLGKKCHTFYGVDIAGSYEILVPCYDLDILTSLIDIHEIK